MYKIRIYHRNAVKEDLKTEKLVLDRNPLESALGTSVGHSIVALYDGTTEIARGLYPNNKYEDETKTIKDAKKYQEEHPDEKVFHVIEIDLTKEQYKGAFNKMEEFEPYVGEEIPKEVLGSMYRLLGNNCADLSNTVYRGTGLPGNFTYQMTTQQLDKAPGAVAWYVKTFGVGDKPHKVPSDLSLEEFAAEWRIPVSSLSVAKNNGPVVKPNPLVLSTQPKHVYTIAPNPALVAGEAAGRIQRAFESLYPNIEGGIFEGIFEEVEKQPREESTSARSVVYLPTHETTASIKDEKSTAQDLLELQRSNFQAITATEGTQLDENFAQLAVTEEERESKVKSIVVTALKAFTGKFKAMRDKFIKKLVEQSEKEISDLKEAGQAEYNTGEKAIHQQKEQEIEAKGEQLKSSFDSQVAALELRKQGECDAFFLKGQSECEAVFAARCGAASNQPSTSGLALSICVDNSDVVAQKNSELSAFKAQKSAEMEAEIQALRAQNINELKSFADSKEEEADQRCKELQSSIEQRLKSTRKSVIELAENEVKKEETQIAKYKRKIKDIQDDNVLIDRIKELVGNSGDASAEALINEELNVFLQGVASDFGVDAVNL